MQATLTRADSQSRQVRMAAAANGWDAKDLHRALEAAGHAISYEKVRRIMAGERTREVEYDTCKDIADVTGFPVDWIQGEALDLPEWVAKKAVPAFPILGLTTYRAYADAA